MQCEHCGLPDKRLWQTKCRYTWWLPYKAEFVSSGADRPCALDAYQAESEADQADYLAYLKARDRRFRRIATIVVLGALVLFLQLARN